MAAQSNVSARPMPPSLLQSKGLFPRLLVSVRDLCQSVFSDDGSSVVLDLKSLESKIHDIQGQLCCFSVEEQNLFITSGALNSNGGTLKSSFNELEQAAAQCLVRLDAAYRQRHGFVYPIRAQLSQDVLDLMTKNQKKIQGCMELMLKISKPNRPVASAPQQTCIAAACPNRSIASTYCQTL